MADTSSTKQAQSAMERSGEDGWKAMQEADFVTAEACYRQALKVAHELGDAPAEAVFLSCLALARQNQGRPDEARKDLERCLEMAQQHGLLKIEAHSRFLLGEQDRLSGDSDSAIQQFMGALEAAFNCQDEVGMEMAFGNLGLLYLERGWAEQASECFRQALATAADSPNQAAWLGSLGQSLAELGQYDEAINAYVKSFVEAERMGNLNAMATARGSQGNALFEQNRLDDAISCYREAIALSRQADDPGREGIWNGNLGNAYRKLGDIEAAIAFSAKALEIARSAADNHSEAAHLDSLGDCYVAQGNLDLALSHYQQALNISQTISDRQGERIYLSNIGRAHHRLGQMKPAFEFLRRAIDLFDEQRSQIRTDDLKTSFATRGQDLYRDMVQVCLAMGRRVEALEYVGRAKSRAILDLLSNSPIDVTELEHEDDQTLKTLVERESELRTQIERLERALWQGPPTTESTHRGATISPEDTHKVYVEWRDVINQLRRRHPNYANLIAVETLNFGEIQSLWKQDRAKKKKADLGKNVAILEYYWTDSYFLSAAIWADCAEPAVQFTNDPAALKSLEADLADFLEMSATEGWEVPLSLCGRLYDKLMAPLLKALPQDVDRLILVPHGSLYRLPFAALHNGKEFVIERFALSHLPATSLIPILSGSRPQSIKGKAGYLVSAISDYSATREGGLVFSSRLRSAAGLEDLSYTMEEARDIFDLGARHNQETKLLTNQEVKESLPALFSQYPVVHFAGHAVFNPDEPLASGLVLSDGSILSAASILQGNLLRTHCGRLLVLSACQTGVNMVTPGGEILGLARALMYAGMPNLILSLWEVADRSTANLMRDFHQIWQSGKRTIAQALSEAQRKAIGEKQPIHAWAPFIHLGIE